MGRAGDGVTEYNLISNFIIETEPHKLKAIEEAIHLALIDVVEAHDSYIGGSLEFDKVTE